MKISAGWKILTIRGIELRLGFSLIFLVIYVVFLAALQLPFIAAQAGINPSSLHGRPFVWGLVFALGIFISIVLHELGHSFVAQAAGVKVRSITLMMLGGVSSIEHIPERPGFEFRLAIVGPLVSIVLGGLLLLIKAHTSSLDLAFFCFWLGGANLLLGIFNLLPAFPLDGGRALRAILASRVGMIRGTRQAVAVSKVLAVLMGIYGLLHANLLLMLIAFFVYMAAQRELFYLVSKALLHGMTVGDILLRVQAIESSELLNEAANRMITAHTTALPVRTDSNASAILTLDRVADVPRTEWNSRTVKEMMREVPRALDVDEPMGEVFPELSSAPGGALPVLQHGLLAGVARYSDLMELIQLKSLERSRKKPGERSAA